MKAKYFIMVMALCSANFSLFAVKNQVKVYYLHENQKEYVSFTMKRGNDKYKLNLPANSFALEFFMTSLVSSDNNEKLKTINTTLSNYLKEIDEKASNLPLICSGHIMIYYVVTAYTLLMLLTQKMDYASALTVSYYLAQSYKSLKNFCTQATCNNPEKQAVKEFLNAFIENQKNLTVVLYSDEKEKNE